MEATGNCTIAIGTTQEARKQANSIINAIYKGYVSCPVVAQPLVMPHVRHVCVLLPIVMPHIRYMDLDPYIGVSLKCRTTCSWSFSCGFAYATAMGYAGFKLSFGITILL